MTFDENFTRSMGKNTNVYNLMIAVTHITTSEPVSVRIDVEPKSVEHTSPDTFDENFTRSMGKNTNVYNLMIAVITAVIIVLAMNLVGSLLITALLVFPALSAMRVMTSFKSVIIYSAILSVFGAVFGISIFHKHLLN